MQDDLDRIRFGQIERDPVIAPDLIAGGVPFDMLVQVRGGGADDIAQGQQDIRLGVGRLGQTGLNVYGFHE